MAQNKRNRVLVFPNKIRYLCFKIEPTYLSMRKTLYNILSCFLFLIAGCSENDDTGITPQSVRFITQDISVNADAHRLNLTIEANCPWTITDQKNKVYAETKEGYGSLEIPIIVFYNPEFKSQEYTITVSSEDKTSTDTLIIKQGEAKGLVLSELELINPEGGLLEFPFKTNDSIELVTLPDWIELQSSRSLNTYTYTLLASSNKTGKPRSGYIKVKGGVTSEEVKVEQDSYTPVNVNISQVPDIIPVIYTEESNNTEILSYPVSLEPEYADWDKLSIKTTKQDNYNIFLKESNLYFQCKTNKKYHFKDSVDISFYAFNNQLSTKTLQIESVKGDFLSDIELEVYKGEEFKIETDDVPCGYVDIILPEDKAVTNLDNFMFRTETVGIHTIQLIHKLTGDTKNITVKSDKVLARAFLSYSYNWGTNWDVEITGEVKGLNIQDHTTCFIDGNSGILTPLNKIHSENGGINRFVTNKYKFSIIARDKDELKYKISRFKFLFSGSVDGETIEKEVNVSVS